MTYQFANNCQFDGPTLNEIYEKAFGVDKKDGFFVEIGASNGQDYSNTSCLSDAGWTGIYVEPVPALADACRERHKHNKIAVVDGAVSSVTGAITIWMIPEWQTATLNHDAAAKITSQKPIPFTVQSWTLDELLLKQRVPVEFDLLVIDVDYGEIEVLKGFSINFWFPKMVIIELHEDSQQPLSEEIRQFAYPYFENAGYKKIYKDFINTIYERP
jgi:FkbM family methyltransferase